MRDRKRHTARSIVWPRGGGGGGAGVGQGEKGRGRGTPVLRTDWGTNLPSSWIQP